MDAEGLWGARLEDVLKQTITNIFKLSKIYNLNVIKIYIQSHHVYFFLSEKDQKSC